MVEPFTRLLSELQKWAPTVRGQCSETWGSTQNGFRLSIRQSMGQALPGLSTDDQIDNLDTPPRPRGWSVSVSHTHNLGGWMAVLRETQIGWDVERKDRIKRATVERICDAEELEQAPQPEFLWPAKEAYYKALEEFQPLTLPELTIVDWETQGADVWTWKGLGPRNGQGVLIAHETWLFAGCLIVS